MQLTKMLLLAVFLTGAVKAGGVGDRAAQRPTAVTLSASITGANRAESNDAMHRFAMACGLLAFAAAGQQAFASRSRATQRVRAGKS